MLPVPAFRDFIHEQRLFDPSDQILLAVSGGKDSVLMAHLFNEAGFRFGIAHCNFTLRGAESDGDEAFTRELAAGFGVPFYTVHFDTGFFAATRKISVQMAARELRYDWFEEIRKANDYQFIAIAHHRNDAVETMLLNLTRGTGIAGLHGIRAKRGSLIRPLLFLKRDEIDELTAQNGLAYREDSSNLSVKYARNKIRRQVIPVLKTLNPDLENTFESGALYFAELEEFLNYQVDKLREELFSETSPFIKINISRLMTLHPRKLLWFGLFRPFGFSAAVLDDLAGSLPTCSGKIFRSKTHQLLADREYLFLSPVKENDPAGVTVLQATDAMITWNGLVFSQTTRERENTMFTSETTRAFTDTERLVYPLLVRSWRQGDVFRPLGMKGQKKLSDFFTSQKIPLNQKSAIAVLVNGNGEIIWVAGWRMDDRYKINQHTKKVTIFETVK
ncbi:tRNA lysidine(34) synthetase TilS [Hufsiella ginkgonis]|uniref:tRNA(Ile)-lysidine synthase n=1 Tax=Hufsiella ginkgonis TaxID=2695274 RepID=A0A7K1XYM8_9SPHI|nr:tRNA lysidine(34) synthetase TilS [Hufsiella ginkgonis]MXV16052.1 tRNA lysidine(34) synthetase TilS [Hufsiella ginkgonis]